MPLTLDTEPGLRRTGDLLIICGLISFMTCLLGVGIGYTVAASQEPTVAVQMYVTAVDDGADVERYAIEQAGDQFTYDLSESVLRKIQSTPNDHVCVDELAITSIWTQYAEKVTCEGPAIHVVLIAPY